MGRAILQSDGYHSTAMFLFRKGQPLATIELKPEDQQDKYVLMSHAAEDILTYDADEVIVSSEVWMAPAPEDKALAWVRPGDRADRTEGFITDGVSRQGKSLTLATPFDRIDGKIVLGEIEASDRFPNYRFCPSAERGAGRSGRRARPGVEIRDPRGSRAPVPAMEAITIPRSLRAFAGLISQPACGGGRYRIPNPRVTRVAWRRSSAIA